MKITTRTTITEIGEHLHETGFAELADRAGEIKRAFANGCLLWTAERLTTTDASRIDARAERRV